MPPHVCRSVFLRGARQADLAIVEGTLEHPQPAVEYGPSSPCACRSYAERPGPIAPLIETLNLPSVAVVDCRSWDTQHVPWVPPAADGVFFDGVADRRQLEQLRLMVKMVHGKPTIAGLESLPAARAGLSGWSAGRPVPRELLAPLVRSVLAMADWGALKDLAESRPFPSVEQDGLDVPASLLMSGERRFRVAYAQDEAFGAYFPDTLEALEMLGAELVEFSPLRAEALPRSVDLVMIGCGFPDLYAEELSANLSLRAELQAHVCKGHRIYAEGGGAAYLGRSMVIGGRPIAGAGILPFDARLVDDLGWPKAVERELVNASWLGTRGTVVRGYRSGRWNLLPAPEPGDCPARSGRLTAEPDMVFRSQAIGSLVHLHLGALPEVVAGFAGRRQAVADHRKSLTR
jgi:cobyrinic acid a,c-diamide synthase